MQRSRDRFKILSIYLFLNPMLDCGSDPYSVKIAAQLRYNFLVHHFEFVNWNITCQNHKRSSKVLLKRQLLNDRHEVCFSISIIAVDKSDLPPSICNKAV